MKLSVDGCIRRSVYAAFAATVAGIATPAIAADAAEETAVLVAQAEPAAPADAPAKSSEPVKLEAVKVTGSRIRQANYVSPVPMQTVDSRQIELTGQANVGDIIRDLPVAGVSAITPTNSNFAVSGSGITTVDLRNLGESRTLVLVNGRRFVSGLAGEQTVDFNSIPTDFIERIDVITGGASAVYGSDALAGAVNIILKDKFEGVSVSGQVGQTFDDKDDVKNSYRITGGSTFAEGKGSAIFNASWSESKGVFARDRSSTAFDCTNAAFFSGDAADFRDCSSPTFSSFPANTRIQIPVPNAANNGTFPVQGTTANRRINPETGAVETFSTPIHGFNRNGIRALSTPLERSLLSSVLSYEIDPAAKVFFEGTYARTKANSELEPFPLGSDSVFGVLPNCQDTDQNGNLDTCDLSSGVRLNSGVVPQALRDAVLARNPDLTNDTAVVGFARRLTEVGNRGASSVRQTFRTVTGLEGDLLPFVGQGLFSDLRYEFSFNYGTTSDNQISNGQLNVANMREAFNTTTLADGSVACANPTAVAEGCVPVFIFGQNTITPDALAYIQAPVLRDVVIEQIITGGFVSGRIGKLPMGGPVGFSVGAERRVEKSRDTPDALTQTGQNAGNFIPAQQGSFDVEEVFAEISVPVLVDQPFAKYLEVKGGIRASDYSTIGSTLAYSVGLDWAVNDWARGRAQYAKAVRAPNIGELFSSGGETFAAVQDPCAGVTRTSSGQAAFFNTRQNLNDPNVVLNSGIDADTIGDSTAQNCLADPSIAARVTAAGGLALTQAEAQGTGGFVGGSPALGVLTEETAKSYTYGAVFTPQFGNQWVDALTLSVDYYNIKVDDAIETVGRQLSLDECYGGDAGFGAGNPFCSNVRRFGTGPQVGALDGVDGGFLNIASLKTSGVDTQASYRFKLNDLVSGYGDLGRFLFSATYTHLLTQKSEAFGVVTNDRGKVGDFKDRALLNFLYNRGPLTANWEINYLSKAAVDVFETDDRAGSLPSVAFHDVQLRYAFGKGKDVRTTVVLGVNNVFDKFVEIGGTNGDLGQPVGSRTFPDVYEPFGRAWYAGVKVDL